MTDSPTSIVRCAKRFHLVWLAFAASTFLLILSNCQSSEPQESQPAAKSKTNRKSLQTAASQHKAIGRKLTNVNLQGLTGGTKAVKLADLRGRVTMIHIWGTWCPPCVREIPHIAEIEKTYRKRNDFLMLAIPCGAEPNTKVSVLLADTTAFLKRHQLDLPTYADVNDQTRANIQKIVGWRGFPATVVLDSEGKIRGVWPQYQAGSVVEMKKLVAELLEKR